jgi:serine/threonine-protein kinase
MAGEYRLRRKLGEGGFGAVYEAEHPVLKRRAAVKVLHQVAGRDSEAVLRFIAEAQSANQIRSRHITDIFSFGQLADGRHFYVMDLLEGEPLDRYLAREIRLDPVSTLQLLRPIAEALDAAHAAGIVHRDLKPQNVFLAFEANGEAVPKLLDFGMAKLLGDSPVHTLSGTPLGTPLYMSPEQARGEKVDGRSDVYALGVLCHELLTGRLPITGDSTVVVLMAHLVQSAPRISEVCPDLSPELDEPVLRMLDKNPERRPATAGAALASLLEAAARAGYEVPAGMPRLRPPPALPAPSVEDSNDEGRAPAQEFGEGEGDDARGGLAMGTTEPVADAATSDARSSSAVAGQRGQTVERRRGWAIPAMVMAGLVLAFFVGSRLGGVGALDGSKVEGPPAAPMAPPEAVPPRPARAVVGEVPTVSGAAAPAAAAPATIALTVKGAPRGARIAVGGKRLGDAPGPVNLPFSEAPVTATITAAGYEPASVVVVPNRPLEATVKLKKRSAGQAPGAPIPSDLESPF